MCFPVVAGVIISINWATKSDVFMALLAIYTALIRNCFSIMQTISVDIFPTAFRSVALSLTMMCGRIASMVGNLIFPVLLDLGCNVVFFFIGAILMSKWWESWGKLRVFTSEVDVIFLFSCCCSSVVCDEQNSGKSLIMSSLLVLTVPLPFLFF